MQFSVLSSGSKSNSCYVEIQGRGYLIDCGLSARETERRLREIAVSPENMKAIFVTHEHGDHVRGLAAFARKFSLPVYGTHSTLRFLSGLPEARIIESGQHFQIDDVLVHAFPLVHDAEDPVGYTLVHQGIKFSMLTDTGKITKLIRDAVQGSHGLLLESNHDMDRLSICEYPWMLKQRILSSHGHLSNVSAAEFLKDILHPHLQCVVLGHLSENSNSPELALSTFEEMLPGPYPFELQCASVAVSSPLFQLCLPTEAVGTSEEKSKVAA